MGSTPIGHSTRDRPRCSRPASPEKSRSRTTGTPDMATFAREDPEREERRKTPLGRIPLPRPGRNRRATPRHPPVNSPPTCSRSAYGGYWAYLGCTPIKVGGPHPVKFAWPHPGPGPTGGSTARGCVTKVVGCKGNAGAAVGVPRCRAAAAVPRAGGCQPWAAPRRRDMPEMPRVITEGSTRSTTTSPVRPRSARARLVCNGH